MRHARDRERVVTFARRLVTDGLATGTAGNLSLRCDDAILVTPSGVPYDELTAGLVCVVDLEGEPVDAPAAPSSELPMHLAAYRATGAGAVVHSHSPFATAVSTVVAELPAVHYLVALLGGPVRVAPYALPGSDVLAASVGRAVEGRTAVLLQNHGALTVGFGLEAAYQRATLLEWLCTVYHQARQLGEPRILTEAELDAVAERLRDYGPA